MNDIILVGRFPPPIGGVSVYLHRRYHDLRLKGEKVDKIDLKKKTALFYILLSRSKNYEVNTLNILVVFLFFILRKMKKTVFVDHNASRNILGFKKYFFLYLIKDVKEIKIVNESLRYFYPENQNVNLISPFIPPAEVDEADILKSYPPQLLNLLGQNNILVNSCWKYVPYGLTDLYGIEDSIKAAIELNCFLILFIASFDKKSLPEKVVQGLNELNFKNKLVLVTGQKEMWPIFKYNPIFLRLTPTDGDSVSVREALYFNSKVIASNVTSRPKGCILYDYGNFNDLIDKIKEHIL